MLFWEGLLLFQGWKQIQNICWKMKMFLFVIDLFKSFEINPISEKEQKFNFILLKFFFISFEWQVKSELF